MAPASPKRDAANAEKPEVIDIDDSDAALPPSPVKPASSNGNGNTKGKERLAPKAHEAEAIGIKEDDGHASDTGSLLSDSIDPALFDQAIFDEEEGMQPEGSADGNSTKKPGFQGGYNAMKTFNGQYYSGMGIGQSHVWNYQPGVWKETKKEPDLWEIDYKTPKIRNHKAPSGSGAPVGTEYHWLVVASQRVVKVDANTYETHLTGSKYKLAHKSVGQA